jgi:hypothetical protein
MQGEATVNDIARGISRIYAPVENQQADHQASVVELEGYYQATYLYFN